MLLTPDSRCLPTQLFSTSNIQVLERCWSSVRFSASQSQYLLFHNPSTGMAFEVKIANRNFVNTGKIPPSVKWLTQLISWSLLMCWCKDICNWALTNRFHPAGYSSCQYMHQPDNSKNSLSCQK